MIHLKKLGFGACGTAKNGSGIAHDMMAIRALSNKKDRWGKLAVTTVEDEVFCLSWCDNNTVFFMTTAHSEEGVKVNDPLLERPGIFDGPDKRNAALNISINSSDDHFSRCLFAPSSPSN